MPGEIPQMQCQKVATRDRKQFAIETAKMVCISNNIHRSYSFIKQIDSSIINDINILPLYRWMKKEARMLDQPAI